MDPLSLVIPFFVTARAVSHSVQMHDRYYEEYHATGLEQGRRRSSPRSPSSSMPTLSGIVTDALGMLVILLVPVVILQRIAISASIWVASIIVSELLLNPIIYYYLKAPDKENVLARERAASSASSTCVEPTSSRRSAAGSVVVACGSLALALAVTQLQHI